MPLSLGLKYEEDKNKSITPVQHNKVANPREIMK